MIWASFPFKLTNSLDISPSSLSPKTDFKLDIVASIYEDKVYELETESVTKFIFEPVVVSANIIPVLPEGVTQDSG